ncbi:MAG: C10 family peptidase [Planctomycetota bacterium]
MDRRVKQSSRQSGGMSTIHIVLAFLVLLLSVPADLLAKPLGAVQAQKAVRGWLKVSPKPLGAALGKQVGKVETFTDDEGEPAYYVVYLEPSGFVIVPADDLVEPIIAFVAEGAYDPSDDKPLGALVSADVPARVAAARELQTGGRGGAQDMDAARQEAWRKASFQAQDKWDKLKAYDDTVGVTGLSGISDVRVAPVVRSKWSQSSECGHYCYNYYTPEHYVCGCVATAMAQSMRFHEHPVDGIGVHTFTIRVDNEPQQASTLGGNGQGGPYRWSYMVLDPDCDNYTDERWEAIGALCYDAGVSVRMKYSGTGSGAYLSTTRDELVNTFGYSSAIYGSGMGTGPALTSMINPNLDANHPLILGISGCGAHAIICDGYGYNAATLYHHLNMGWGGSSDAWYDLPDVLCFNSVGPCLYNIFTSGSGEIISGRITDPEGVPLSGAIVTADDGGPSPYVAASNEKGIYAVAKVPSNTTFTVSVKKSGLSFSDQIVATGTSIQHSATCGNLWGVDFTGIVSAGAIQFSEEFYVNSASVSVTLEDQDLLDANSQEVVIRGCGGDRETVTLSQNPVGSGTFEGAIPTAEAAVSLEDGTLQFSDTETIVGVYEDADDGSGSPALVTDTAMVTGPPAVLFQTNFTGGLPAGWSIVDAGDSTGDTWTWTNPGGKNSSYWTGTFMIVDSDWFGWLRYGAMDEQLITHNIDCSGYMSVTLKFKHYFRYCAGGANEIGDVDIRVGEGAWQNLLRHQGADAAGLVTLDVSAYAAGQTNVQFRWHYYDADYDYYWGIDDVQITSVMAPETIPADFEPDCDVDFRDFAVLASAWLSSQGQSNWDPDCDISDPQDGLIDELDLDVLAQNWLMDSLP